MWEPFYAFFPRYLSDESARAGHLPFAYDLVRFLRPALLVEVGTWSGDSFFTFCQSIVEHAVNARCYAVCEPRDDKQGGDTRDLQFTNVQAYCSATYSLFASLLREDLASAAREFDGQSIDLLNIEGAKSYEALSGVFATWFPKIRPGGVVLFQGIDVRNGEDHSHFGIGKLWDELKAQHRTFEWSRFQGLGILIKDSNPEVEAWFHGVLKTALSTYYGQRGDDLIAIAVSRKASERSGAVAAKLQEALAKLRQSRIEGDSLRDERDALRDETTGLSKTISRLNSACEGLKVTCSEAKGECESMRNSLSWRLTRPLRLLRDIGNPLFNQLKRRRVTAPAQLSERRENSRPAVATRPLTSPSFDPKPIEAVAGQTHFSRGDGRRLICVSPVLPHSPQTGSQYRINRMLSWLAKRNWEILLMVCPSSNEIVTEAQMAEAARVYGNLVVCQRDGKLRYRLTGGETMLDGLRGRRPRDFSHLLEGIDSDKLQALIREICPDALIELLLHLESSFEPHVLLAEHLFMTPPFAVVGPQIYKAVDAFEMFSTVHAKLTRDGKEARGLSCDPVVAEKLLSRADLLIAINAAQADTLRKLAPQPEVVNVGVDLTFPDEGPAPASKPVVLLVASDDAGSVKGLEHFLRFAWPLIRRALPEAELQVIGPVSRDVEGDCLGVRVLGRTENLPAVYAGARVVIDPVVADRGLNLRLVEAVRHLRPIVLWPSAVDGLMPEISELCHVASNWFDFASHVIRLAKEEDAKQEIDKRRAGWAKKFSAQAVYAALDTALNSGMVTRRKGEPL